MEDRHHLKSVRTTHSVIHDAPREKHSHHHKRAVIFIGVALSMIVISALYVASFRYRNLTRDHSEDFQRWGLVRSEFSGEAKPILDGLRDITTTLTEALNVGKVRAKSIELLKEKLVASASATDEVESASSTPTVRESEENKSLEN